MKTPAQLFALVLLCMIFTHSPAAEITVAAASNFTAPMNVLTAEFERASGHKVKLAFGSSGKLYAQIKNGAPFQILFSADQAKPLALEEAGLTVPGSRFTYAIGSLVLWSPRMDLKDEDLKQLMSGKSMGGKSMDGKLMDRKLALANPRLAPYGAAAVDVLTNLGLEEKTRANWVRGENIAQTFQFVDSGNADVGFVSLSQVMENGKITKGSAWLIPPELYRPIRQDAVLLSPDDPAARAFLTFMRSVQARNIIRSFGYSNELPAP